MSGIEMTDASGRLRSLADYEQARRYYAKQLIGGAPEAALNAIVVIELLDVVIANLKRLPRPPEEER